MEAEFLVSSYLVCSTSLQVGIILKTTLGFSGVLSLLTMFLDWRFSLEFKLWISWRDHLFQTPLFYSLRNRAPEGLWFVQIAKVVRGRGQVSDSWSQAFYIAASFIQNRNSLCRKSPGPHLHCHQNGSWGQLFTVQNHRCQSTPTPDFGKSSWGCGGY